MKGGPRRVVGGCFALTAFSVAIVAGLAAHNPATMVLLRALVAMVLCYPLGLLVGWLCEHVVESHREAVIDRGESPDRSAGDHASQADCGEPGPDSTRGEEARAA